eukprot:GEMP01079974.1.p1 GENE.GEMP01079974.1~~GEMP01079974.1.p1  ORF type:complete len:110 (-),score=2.53 GEMP01079974.1:348-677(-)
MVHMRACVCLHDCFFVTTIFPPPPPISYIGVLSFREQADFCLDQGGGPLRYLPCGGWGGAHIGLFSAGGYRCDTHPTQCVCALKSFLLLIVTKEYAKVHCDKKGTICRW